METWLGEDFSNLSHYVSIESKRNGNVGALAPLLVRYRVSIESKRNGNLRKFNEVVVPEQVSIESKRNGNSLLLFNSFYLPLGFNRI